ncbi:MAG: hypothetical protein WC683_12660 [bacterium]
MPTSQLATNLGERKRQIEELLHNGNDVTNKDLGWLLYGMNGDMTIIAQCVKELMCKPENWAWKTARETVVKTISTVGLALLVWLFMEFARSGFKLP